MLAELAAANAAFSIIKRTIRNGKELFEAGEAIGKLVHAHESVRDKATKRKNSMLTVISNKKESDLEEFMALEKMKRYDAELKEFMLIHGRPNLYTDYIKFCALQTYIIYTVYIKSKHKNICLIFYVTYLLSL